MKNQVDERATEDIEVFFELEFEVKKGAATTLHLHGVGVEAILSRPLDLVVALSNAGALAVVLIGLRCAVNLLEGQRDLAADVALRVDGEVRDRLLGRHF